MTHYTVRIWQEAGRFYTSFPYSQELVSLIKTTKNRIWNGERRIWELDKKSAKIFHKIVTERKIPMLCPEETFVVNLVGNHDVKKHKLRLPLYPFQEEDANKLVNNSYFGVFSEVGVGKTIISIAAINYLKQEKEINRVLIICPNSLKRQWQEEIKKFSWMSSEIIKGTKAERPKKWMKKVTIKIVNYEMLLRDVYPFEHLWDVIILDEVSKIKNNRSKASLLVKQLRSKYRWALTGTPIENSPTDIYSIMQFLNPVILGSFTRFKNEYIIETQKTIRGNTFNEIIGYKNLSGLKEIIKEYYLRRTKEEVFKDFPPVIESDIYIQLSPRARKLYIELRDVIINFVSAESVYTTTGRSLVACMRIFCSSGYALSLTKTKFKNVLEIGQKSRNENQKLEEIVSFINNLDRKDKVIVFSDFTTPFIKLSEMLDQAGISHAFMTGKKKELEKFKKECRVLLAQMKTGGYGLNLQEANYCLFLNEPWTKAAKEQAIGRLHRKGQEKTVFVYNFIVEDTIEERVRQIIDKKKRISDDVILKDIGKYL